jgi:hypothetical protein
MIAHTVTFRDYTGEEKSLSIRTGTMNCYYREAA